MKAELLCLMVLVICVHADKKPATAVFDETEHLDQVVRTNRLMKSIYDCLVDLKTCTPYMIPIKNKVPEILRTKCGICSPEQKKRYKSAFAYLMKNKPDIWAGLVKKFDPTGELTKNMMTDPNFFGRV